MSRKLFPPEQIIGKLHYPEGIGGTLTFYRLPLEHHRHMKSGNLLGRFTEEIKRRTGGCGSSRMRPAV
jgi:transposase-like protein